MPGGTGSLGQRLGSFPFFFSAAVGIAFACYQGVLSLSHSSCLVKLFLFQASFFIGNARQRLAEARTTQCCLHPPELGTRARVGKIVAQS